MRRGRSEPRPWWPWRCGSYARRAADGAAAAPRAVRRDARCTAAALHADGAESAADGSRECSTAFRPGFRSVQGGAVLLAAWRPERGPEEDVLKHAKRRFGGRRSSRARSEHAWFILSLTYPQPHAIFASTNGTMHAHRPAESASAVTLRRFEKVTPTFPEAERRRSLCLFSHPGAAAPFASARAMPPPLPLSGKTSGRTADTSSPAAVGRSLRADRGGCRREAPPNGLRQPPLLHVFGKRLGRTADAAGRVARFLRRLPHSKKIQP